MGEALGLIGSEPAGTILMTLGQRALQTKHLTNRVTDFSARSVYRSLAKLEAFGLVEHRPDRDTPSKVLLWLTKPAGRNLYHLLCRFMSVSPAELWSEESGLSWESLRQLGGMWEEGFAAELGREARSLVNLDGTERLSYHQVRRRAGQYVEAGLLSTTLHNGSGRHYALTDRSRRRMVMIASLGRWRHRYLLANGTPGLDPREMATVLQITLPLVTLAGYGGMSIDFSVTGAEDEHGDRETTEMRGIIGENGTLDMGEMGEMGKGVADGSASATLSTWFAALLDDNRRRIRLRGDLTLLDVCLTQLYDELWVPSKLGRDA